ncbi:hypothetical protein BBJ29_001498 [Phytophthora kernoviae]|uniref:VLIG-type G domain-containing protein n=1 Tax=Phytophthora kernoviae TaxID=325452 RepID=A0A3F2S343_9STRA|nr:hypothetical protein BBJ29_001498 [Phytophthora kernoviae]RLN68610.1 hypothetical protein BBP00_00000869 [Phytophthora kernoviae]
MSLLMSDLLALNKPLNGLNLTEGLAVAHTLDGITMEIKSLVSLLQALITFLPIQICRAEGNALTVLRDGVDDALNELDLGMQTWEAIDIAESIRFGLLSPLLSAWRGRCIVITSMGKQSTGKSYFLNHLTGSSFAIAGNRCTDGAWMSLRMMKGVLLVVLDFEGLGSFEHDVIDFGPICLAQGSVDMGAVHLTLLSLFQRYLALISKGPLNKLTDKDYTNFDAVLSFMVRRRETKVAVWVKQLLGAERFINEWEQIEQMYLSSFEAILSRFDEAHDCACEYLCDKVFGHKGSAHSTSHGNMRNMSFVSKDGIVKWENRTYAPGEKGIAEMCNMYCSSAGRGHVHYLNELGLSELANKLGGSVHEATEAADLCETFRSLSMSLGARAGLMLSGGG